MAYLSKEQYARRAENAARRMAENKEVATITEEQHDALAALCAARHELHSNIDRVTRCADRNEKKDLVKINIELAALGIPCPCLPISEGDCIDIDALDEDWVRDEYIDDNGDIDEDAWNKEYCRIYSELEKLNKEIEKFLSEIDAKHGTNYCPTGALRIF